MSKADFLERMRTGRRALNEAISGLSEEQIAHGQITPEWTLRDVLAHIAAWQNEARIWIERAGRGERIGPFMDEDVDQWNARRVEERRRLPLVDVIQEFNDAQDTLLALLDQWPEDAIPLGPNGWTATARLWWLTDHDVEHLAQIRAYRERLAAGV